MINKETIIKYINMNPEAKNKYDFFTKLGMEFSITQLHLMFFPRGYGKTFMSMCEVMYDVKDFKEFILSFEHLKKFSKILIMEGKDVDIYVHNNLKRKEQYLYDFTLFVEKYFPNYKLMEKDKRYLHYKKGEVE